MLSASNVAFKGEAPIARGKGEWDVGFFHYSDNNRVLMTDMQGTRTRKKGIYFAKHWESKTWHRLLREPRVGKTPKSVNADPEVTSLPAVKSSAFFKGSESHKGNPTPSLIHC